MDEFLNEAWKNKAIHEVGEDISEGLATPEMELERYEKTPAVKIYELIKEQTGQDEVTRDLFKELRESVLHYYSSIVKLEKTVAMDYNKEAVEAADDARRYAHNALIDSLNIISRYVGKLGLDNGWRSVIGLERTKVTDWVKDVAPYIVLTANKER